MPYDKQLQDMLNSRGYAVRPLEMGGRPKTTVWKKSQRSIEGTDEYEEYWSATPNMPGDAVSIKGYLTKGFELADPTSTEVDHPSIQKTKKVEPVKKQQAQPKSEEKPKPKAKPKAEPKVESKTNDLVSKAVKATETSERNDQASSE